MESFNFSTKSSLNGGFELFARLYEREYFFSISNDERYRRKREKEEEDKVRFVRAEVERRMETVSSFRASPFDREQHRKSYYGSL